MEWIKASERLPEFNRDVAIRYKGQLYVGWLEKVETSTYFNMQGYDSRLSIQEIIKIEWLDESAPDTVQGQEELWEDEIIRIKKLLKDLFMRHFSDLELAEKTTKWEEYEETHKL